MMHWRQQDRREQQLPALSYSRWWSRFLYDYHQARDHPARLRILRLLERCTGNRRIIAPVKGGFVMALDAADIVQRTIFASGEYEPEVTRILLCELRQDDVFYDVGANVGYYACHALKMGLTSVFAFEPDPLSAAVLRLNLRLNQFTAGEVVELASG